MRLVPLLLCTLICSVPKAHSAVEIITPVDTHLEQHEIEVALKQTNKRWEIAASMHVQLSPSSFIGLLESAPADCSWMHNCVSVTLLSKSDKNTREIQTVFNSPWPFDDRVMRTKSTILYEPEQTAVSVIVRPSELPASSDDIKDRVVVTNPRGQWLLRPHEDHFILSYNGSADSDPVIPSFLLNGTLISATRKTFENIYQISLQQRTKSTE